MMVDVFNAINRTNVTGIAGAMSSPFFGRANAAASARTVQFSVKYLFEGWRTSHAICAPTAEDAEYRGKTCSFRVPAAALAGGSEQMRATVSNAGGEEHPADAVWGGVCRAWRRIKPDCVEPQNIEVLQLTKKNAIYRLTSVRSNGPAVIAKRCRPTIASVERLIYETLQQASLPALNCYGLVPEPGGEFCWLFMEDAGGHQYSVNREDHLTLAGRWLGVVHGACGWCDLEAQLPDRGPGHYLNLVRSIRTGVLARVDESRPVGREQRLLRTMAAHCELIEARWDELERFCAGVPRTLVHEDFAPGTSASNLARTGRRCWCSTGTWQAGASRRPIWHRWTFQPVLTWTPTNQSCGRAVLILMCTTSVNSRCTATCCEWWTQSTGRRSR